ncbi:hypothetical protein [Nonomuraea lactucae]|uniref:hypothetical protein n=1 Tax=Nonomuraea lactucae TaxID=2249762 RepID=UPI000DE4AEF8|nr:hypothetical protein [Nonomuraea lactucae]
MLVILAIAIAALAILACVVLVSLGRGGELTEFPPDVPPLDLPEPGQLTAVDFMALQLPVNLVGYHTQSVDETLRRAATALSARDTRIAVLEQRVSELMSSRLHARQEVYATPAPGGPRTDHEPEAPAVPLELPEEGDPLPTGGPAARPSSPSTHRTPPEATTPEAPQSPAETAETASEGPDGASEGVESAAEGEEGARDAEAAVEPGSRDSDSDSADGDARTVAGKDGDARP